MKLWEKGIPTDQKIEAFTVGNDREIDIHIAKYDLLASKAHAAMLASVGLLTKEESEQLNKQLDLMLKQEQEGTFVIEADFEDVHSKIESDLVKALGDTGKKIHTARSRNDQVLVALNLYFKAELSQITEGVEKLFDTLLKLAETHKNTLLPGYTHLQVAMPSSFGLWFSAYAELLIDDLYLLKAAQKVVDQNPLGSAAGYGSSFTIDREMTTKQLQFADLKYNVIAAQLSRGKSERTVTQAVANIANTLSRFAMDICLYCSQNFGFIKFPDALTTGSSIMPHKKNPDVFELLRGKCNQLQAIPQEMIMITNNLPSGYHRDYQLLKENAIKSVEDLKVVLDIFEFSIAQVKVKDVNLDDEKYQYLFTVDAINDLVTAGIPFREAYKQIGEQVENGSFKAGNTKEHSHLGSIHNLGLDKIQAKFDKAVS
ncbi:argininosuccinate lyase [Dokdonia donghaensis]|uniref:Argininosuccinate lyase n=1 Tax=Dokdonia donghaensis DSW-1 TaxID=1300343 RepID=A0A0A2GVW7_9FLAO|nr:argininosuccinate lyase [Dokdonia donghaensis]ANH60081.1 Argininosuccinate lyase [Dokdonia donghaensis DSW-1]KGO07384.1 argininosuccinate lyase [Dokdonia donghaensis DSW-1]